MLNIFTCAWSSFDLAGIWSWLLLPCEFSQGSSLAPLLLGFSVTPSPSAAPPLPLSLCFSSLHFIPALTVGISLPRRKSLKWPLVDIPSPALCPPLGIHSRLAHHVKESYWFLHRSLQPEARGCCILLGMNFAFSHSIPDAGHMYQLSEWPHEFLPGSLDPTYPSPLPGYKERGLPVWQLLFPRKSLHKSSSGSSLTIFISCGGYK